MDADRAAGDEAVMILAKDYSDEARALWGTALDLNRAAAAVSPAAGRLPPLLFFTDPERTPRPWETAAGLPTGAGRWPELRSAQRFRETWERIGAEVQVQQARDRAPPNAGPLNPQRLMLDTLARMGELSPHYLRRFLAHTETLLWLEQAQAQLKQGVAGKGTAVKPARGPNRKS